MREFDLPAELHERALAGDIEARNRIVEETMPLAFWFARKQAPRFRRHDIRALVSCAAEGLMRAAEKYDPATGGRFSTYANWWMFAMTQQQAHRDRHWFGEPIHAASEYYGQQVSGETAALHRKWASVGVHAIDGEDGPLYQPAGREPDPSDPLLRAEVADRVGRVLHPREADVIHRHYGLGRPEQTFREIGADLGLSSQRVQQIHSAAMAKLRRHLPASLDPVA